MEWGCPHVSLPHSIADHQRWPDAYSKQGSFSNAWASSSTLHEPDL